MRFGAACIEIRAKLDNLDTDLNDSKRLSGRRAREIQRTAIIVFPGVAAYFGVGELTQLGSAIFETGKHFAQPEKAFKEITGSNAAANREFDFLRRASDDLGKNFYNLADASMSDFATNMDAIVKSMAELTQYEGLHSLLDTAQQASELAKQGRLDWDVRGKANAIEHQRMVDAALAGPALSIHDAWRLGNLDQPPPAILPTGGDSTVTDYTKKELAAFAKGAKDYVDLWRYAAEEKLELLLNFSFSNTSANVKGYIYGPSGIIPFATGGIVNSLTLFKLANGTGNLGGAEPGAVFPLSRVPCGNLGVNALGAGGTVNVINNAGVHIQTQERETPQGPQIDVIVDQAVAGKALQRGSALNRALRYGYSTRESLTMR